MRVIAALSKVSEADLAAVYGVAPGSGPMVNIQQHLMGPAGVTQQHLLAPSNPVGDNSRSRGERVLESFELLNRIIKKSTSGA
jgi:hypothetical protein